MALQTATRAAAPALRKTIARVLLTSLGPILTADQLAGSTNVEPAPRLTLHRNGFMGIEETGAACQQNLSLCQVQNYGLSAAGPAVCPKWNGKATRGQFRESEGNQDE